MLQKIRDVSHGWFTWTILGAVCIAFAFWGVENYFSLGQEGSVVAKVNGKNLTESTLLLATRQLQQQKKAWLDAGVVTQEQLKSMALDQLIKNEIIQQSLVNQGFEVSLEQVKEYLKSLPEFQVDGHYSYKQYSNIINQLPISEGEFLSQVRDTLMMQQLQLGISDSAFVLPNEIAQTQKILNQVRNIGYTIISKTLFAHTDKFTDEQIKQYYDQHLEEFKTPEQVQLEYVELNADTIWQNLSETEKQGKSKELVLSEKSDELAKLSYENAHSLDSIADKLNLKIQTTPYFNKQGGPSGITGNADVLRSAFSDEVMQQGYNSDVLTLDPTTQIVIRIKDYKPSATLPLTEVHEKVEQALLNQWRKQQMEKLANVLVEKINENANDAEKITNQFNLKWETNSITTTDQSANSVISNVAFMQPAPNSTEHPSTTFAMLPSGDIVVLAVKSIDYPNDESTHNLQYNKVADALLKQNQQLDYQLYLQSKLASSKVKKYVKG